MKRRTVPPAGFVGFDVRLPRFAASFVLRLAAED
jgi:hypothetical protein